VNLTLSRHEPAGQSPIFEITSEYAVGLFERETTTPTSYDFQRRAAPPSFWLVMTIAH
jgi:hypothetical protein